MKKLILAFIALTISIFLLSADEKEVMQVQLKSGTIVEYNTDDIDKITFETVFLEESKWPVANEVDLGLSVNWASWDLGAQNAFEDGITVRWGDPTGEKLSVDYDDYPCPFPPDNIGGSEFDIATMQWGAGWRLPTLDEFRELNKNCTLSIGTAYGKTYGKLTSKINGKEIIFIFNDYYSDVYWTSDINKNDTRKANAFCIDPDGTMGYFTNGWDRIYPAKVRPVRTLTFANKTETIEGYEAVDLGLPSGLKWANYNVGAKKPSDNGCYYSWGNTYETTIHNPTNTKTWGLEMSDISGSTYYDAARKNWGGNWRMPTKEDFEELKTNCTFKELEVDGKAGRLVIGPNGNQIFLPYTGSWDNPDFNANCDYYWSSTPDSKYTAYILAIGQYTLIYANSRVSGCPVRAVNSSSTSKDPDSFNVGDVYPNAANPEGLVIEVDNSGKHGKIISWETADGVSWGSIFIDADATNQSDGSKNVLPSGSALNSWVSGLGAGWYVPARTELKAIAGNLSFINECLSKNSLPRIPDGFYWSSTQYSHQYYDQAYVVCVCESMYSGYSAGWDNYNSKDVSRRALAVKNF